MNGAIRFLVAGVLLIAPWAFGSVEPWSQWTIQALVGVMMVCTLAKGFVGDKDETGGEAWNWWWGAPSLALVVYMVLQALNPTHSYEEVGRSLLPRSYIHWLPHSVDADSTWDACGLLVTYGALFWVVRCCFGRATDIKVLLMILVVSGFGMALVAILENVSGEQKLLWLRHTPAPDLMGGPFVNRNNYAAYMNLLVPVALAMGSYMGETRSRMHSKGHPGYLFYFIAAVMVASVLRSGSRAGLVICILVLGGWLWNFMFSRTTRGHRSRPHLLLTVFLVGVAAAGLLVFSGIGPIAERFAPPRNEEEAKALEHSNPRPTAYKTTLIICRDHWWYGTGAGTFHRVFPYYQPDAIGGAFWQYAHFDWLQWVSELGTVGSVLAACGLVGAFRKYVSRSKLERERLEEDPETHACRKRMLPALGFGLAGLALHACVDFPMHIPGIATLVVTYAALVCRARDGVFKR